MRVTGRAPRWWERRWPLALVAVLLATTACQGGGDGEAAPRASSNQDQATSDADDGGGEDGGRSDGQRQGDEDDGDGDGRDGDGDEGSRSDGEVDCPEPGDGGGDGDLLALEDVTEERGLVEPLVGMFGHAAATADVDGDGWLDLYVGTFADKDDERYQERGATGPAPDRLLLGGPDGFTEASGFEGGTGRSSGAAFADLDADGDLDLVVARNVKDDEDDGDDTVVLRNDDGDWSEAAHPAPGLGGRGVGVLDYDGDGRLDLFVAEDRYTGGSSILLRNLGDFEFEEVTEEAGLPDDVHGFGVGAADLTGDGRPDLFVAGSNRLFVNRDGAFAEVETSTFDTEAYSDEDDITGVAIGDVNRDARPDIVLGPHYNSTVDDGCGVPVRLYLHRGMEDGEPMFEDVTKAAGLPAFPTKAPHVELADFDNDGWPDLLASASVAGGERPAVLRHQGLDEEGVPSFAAPEGMGDDQYWVTGATGDFDRDGRSDVFVVEFEPSLPSLLLLNDNQANAGWLEVEVPGDASGVGAVVEVYRAGGAGDPEALLLRREVVMSTGYAAGAPPVVHAGLGDVRLADVVVRPAWGGEARELLGVAAGERIRFPEDFPA